MNNKDTHGIGMILIMLGGAIFFLKTGTNIFHYDTLIYLMIFIGMIFVNKAFNDANSNKAEVKE